MMQRHEINNEAYDAACLAEEAVLAGVRSAEEIGKRLLLPGARTLAELFERADPIASLEGYKPRTVRAWVVDGWSRRYGYRPGEGRAELSSFCPIWGRGVERPLGLDVEPRPEVLEMVEREMLISDGYVISFEVTVRGDGTALVHAHYNMISGSRWFAIVPAAEIPRAGA